MAGPADEKSPAPTAHDPPLKGSVRPPARPGGPKALIGITISDRYKIERLLGEGGMGAVYQAEHTLMRKRMAIKVLHPEMTRLPEVVQRFEREAMAAAHIDHPNVVTATDFGKLDDGSFFLALEFVEGKSLRENIALGRLELGRALHIARQIAAALSRAHTLKIVHRDLKPENVMLVDRDGDPDFVKVLDFGIAKVQIGELTAGDVDRSAGPGQPVLTQAGMVYGTPEYMAPEQALGQPVDPRADLYALGVIMYEMLCGVRPFDAESKVALLGMQVTAPVPPMAQKAPDAMIPPEVEALVGRLLAKEATERLGDARELIEGITNVLGALAASGRIDSRFAPSPTSGIGTNPGIISGISPAPQLPTPLPKMADPRAGQPSGGFLAGKQWLIAAGGGLVGILILVTTIIVVLKGRDPVTSGLDGEAAFVDGGSVDVDPGTEAKIKEAIAKIEARDYGSGIKTLEDLGAEAEGREDVHRALFTAYTGTDRFKEAMREVHAILKANPKIDIAQEKKILEEVRNTAVKEDLKDKDPSLKLAVDDAWTLLQSSLGTEGWDLVYDIAYGISGVNYPKASARAKSTLNRGDRSKMSAALSVTLDLQAVGATNNCPAIKGMLDRAVEKGDVRTLEQLKRLEPARMVGGGGWRKAVDALGCIHEGSLKRAIAELDARIKGQKK